MLNLTKPETVKQAILRAFSLNIFSRAFGYLKNIAVSGILGFSYQTDGVFMALSIIGIFFIFVDVFDSIGVPKLVEASKQSEEKFKRLAGMLLFLTLILTFTLVAVFFLMMPLLLKIPSGFSQQAVQTTRTSLVLLLPYLVFSFFFHCFGAILRSKKRFTHYFMGEFVFSFLSFIMIVAGLLTFKDYRVIPISLSVSQFAASVYMLLAGRSYFSPAIYFDRDIRQIVGQFFWLGWIYGVFYVQVLINSGFASHLKEGSVSALNYGFLVATLPKNLIRLENILITFISEENSQQRVKEYIKKTFILTVPIACVMFLFSELVVSILFGYGAFSATDIKTTAEAVRYYALSIPLMFIWPLIYQFFQVNHRLKTITAVAITGIAVNFIADYLLIFLFDAGLKGVCLGTFASYITTCVAGYVLIKKDVKISV